MNPSKETIGVGVVGLGVGERHARAFYAHQNCEVRSLCDLDVSLAQTLATEFPGCVVAERFEDMLLDTRLDVLAIASFDDAHYSQVISALQAGKHVFVEKPICRTIEELAEIKELWQAKGGRLKLHSNLVLRTAPLYVWLKEQIRTGELGSLYSFDGDYLYGRLHKIAEGWRKDVTEYSVMEGGGVHLVDLLLWLTGERPVAVTASGNRICSEGTQFQYNDFVSATFEFESGFIARISANFGCVHRHHHVLRVFGTNATFLYDDAGARWHRSRDPDLVAEHLPYRPIPANKGDLVPHFVNAILKNTDESMQTQSFFDGISVCIAADRAVTTGNKERIEYV
jgi:predicted dehydrogenase